jgi:hypothetical protein
MTSLILSYGTRQFHLTAIGGLAFKSGVHPMGFSEQFHALTGLGFGGLI